MKIIGIVFTIVGASCFGLIYDMINKGRVKDLESYKRLLIYLKNDIEYALTPILESLNRVCGMEKNRVSKGLLDYAAQLVPSNKKINVEELFMQTYFVSEDIKDIEKFFGEFKGLDKKSQINEIELIIENLTEKITYLKELSDKNSKLYKTMGIMLGVLVVIIFI